MVGAIGHPPAAIAALLSAHDAPGQSIQDLRWTIGLSHGASVRVIDGLERAQLLVRQPARHDGRAVAVHTTEAGSQAALRVLSARSEVGDALVSLVPRAWLPRLVKILETLLTASATDVQAALRICRFCAWHACRTWETAPCPVLQARCIREPAAVPPGGLWRRRRSRWR
jgi:DNA-binding MarR family transcriptional regulator